MDCFININNPRCAIIFRKHSVWLSYICLTSVLCFTLLFLVSCNSPPSGQSGGHALQLQQAPRARLTYVAIGASDTFGLGADDPQTQSWPDDLAMKLGSGVRLVNLGVPGITLHQALNVEIPVAIDAHPNLVTIWLAVNDLANAVPVANYTHDLDLLISRVQRANIHTHIIIANVPDLTLLPYFSGQDPQDLYTQIQDYNNAIAGVVQRHHITLVDLYAHWRELRSHPEDVSADGLHPSTLGYTQIAELFYQALQAKS